jgi:hypothetical protein
MENKTINSAMRMSKSMTDEQRTAYINAKAICMLVEMNAMLAENQERTNHGQALAWGYEQFMELQAKYGLEENTLVKTLLGGS